LGSSILNAFREFLVKNIWYITKILGVSFKMLKQFNHFNQICIIATTILLILSGCDAEENTQTLPRAKIRGNTTTVSN